MSEKLLVVVGATGNQGSSVINSLSSEPGWRIRGLTRDQTSKKAAKLKENGVEPMTADVNDPASLVPAFHNATAIYAVTDFWSPFLDPANQSKVKPGQTINEWSYEHELQQAKNIIDAAAKVGSLEHFIWSGLNSPKKWSEGKYTWVYHFDGKADATSYIKERYPELWNKTSILMMGQYLSNHLTLPILQPRKNSEGVYELNVNCPPTSPWPYIAAAEDTGPFVRALLSVPPGKKLIAYRAYMSPEDFIKTWGTVNNVPARYREISTEEMAADPGTGREGAESYAFVGEFGHEAWADKTVLHPKDLDVQVTLPSIEDWIRKQDWSGILAARAPTS